VLSLRTSRSATTAGGRPIRNVESGRYFQAWRPITTRHGLYHIVKGRLGTAADILDTVGDITRAEQLRQASPHWLRHTFAKAALLSGQDVRHVAAWLGHRDLGTTLVYTEQEALDLIRATNDAAPGATPDRLRSVYKSRAIQTPPPVFADATGSSFIVPNVNKNMHFASPYILDRPVWGGVAYEHPGHRNLVKLKPSTLDCETMRHG
jgi:hypothetical protein